MSETVPDRPPKPLSPLAKIALALWAISPTAIAVAYVAVRGRDDPWLRWVLFLFVVVNAFVFAGYVLRRARVENWLLVTVPLAAGIVLAHLGVIAAISALVGLE